MSERLILRAGSLEAHLLPAAGGSVARFDRITDGIRQPLLRGTDDDEAHALDCGSFPLVPYCNRIRGGEFVCDGEVVKLAPNMPPDRSPLHGQGWLSAWEVVSCGEDAAELRFVHTAGEWPWAYEARQSFALDENGLTMDLTCRNLSDRPMPCGLGQHPYYPCDLKTRLDAQVECAWTIDEDVLPVDRVPADGRYDLRQRAICGQDLDNGFGGWGGSALIEWPGKAAALRLSSPDADYFQVYSPAEGGLFVAEPVQHANAALNAPQEDWSSLGIEMLSEGEERTLRTRFDVIVSAR